MTKTESATVATAALALAIVGGAGVAPAWAQSVGYRPLTVAPHHAPPPGFYAPRRGYDPYAGPGAVVTAPVHFAGTLATMPFRAVNTVFPPQGSPLAVVGAPVYVAGKLVELPFRVVEAPFGGPGPFDY